MNLTFEQGVVVGMIYLGENFPRIIDILTNPPDGSINEILERNFQEVAQKLGGQPCVGFPDGIPKEAPESADELVKTLTIQGNLRIADMVMGAIR